MTIKARSFNRCWSLHESENTEWKGGSKIFSCWAWKWKGQMGRGSQKSLNGIWFFFSQGMKVKGIDVDCLVAMNSTAIDQQLQILTSLNKNDTALLGCKAPTRLVVEAKLHYSCNSRWVVGSVQCLCGQDELWDGLSSNPKEVMRDTFSVANSIAIRSGLGIRKFHRSVNSHVEPNYPPLNFAIRPLNSPHFSNRTMDCTERVCKMERSLARTQEISDGKLAWEGMRNEPLGRIDFVCIENHHKL